MDSCDEQSTRNFFTPNANFTFLSDTKNKSLIVIRRNFHTIPRTTESEIHFQSITKIGAATVGNQTALYVSKREK